MVALEVILSGLLIVSPEVPDTSNPPKFGKVQVYMVQSSAHPHDPQLLIPQQYILDMASLPTFCDSTEDPVVCKVSNKMVELLGLQAGKVELAGSSPVCTTPSPSTWGDFCYVLPINRVQYTSGAGNPKVDGLDTSRVAAHTSSKLTLESGALSSAHCPVAYEVEFTAGSPHRQTLAEHARLRVQVAAAPKVALSDSSGTHEIQLKADAGAISLAYHNAATTTGSHFGAFFPLLRHGFGAAHPRLSGVANQVVPPATPPQPSPLLPAWFQSRVCDFRMPTTAPAATEQAPLELYSLTGSLCPLIRADPITDGG